VTRSRQDFEAKQRRGGGNARHTRVLSEEVWSRFQDGQIDTSIHDFISSINKKNTI
jgi:hypothetical protein